MKFSTTLAVASLLSAVFVSATPIPSELQSEVDAREFSNEDIIFERASLWRGIKKAAGNTWDMAVKKVFHTKNQPVARPAGPGPFNKLAKQPTGPKPRPGGVRPVKVPHGSLVKSTGRLSANRKAIWDAGQKKSKKVIPPRRVPRRGTHVRMPKKGRK